MSYIPPHRRNSKDPNTPSPVPDSLDTKFKKNLNLNSSNDKFNRIIYSENPIWKWFLIGSNGIEDEIPPSVIHVHVSSDSVDCINGEKPSILMNNNVQKVNMNIGEEKTRWVLLVAEKVLSAKRKMTSLTEEEISNIRGLLDSATVDRNVKGGLRWPLGKSSSRDGYRVFEACHVTSTVYKNKTLRLRVRKTDRFNERIGAGEIKREVDLMLKDINTKLQEQNIERGCVMEMLKDALGTLWDFLHCDAYLT